MTSVLQCEKLGAELFCFSYRHNPDTTAAQILTPDGGATLEFVDMRLYEAFGALLKPAIVAASGVTRVELVASVDTTFGTVVVVKDSGVLAASTINSNIWLECIPAELAQLSSQAGLTTPLRYLAARITSATLTDESCCTYIATPKWPQHALAGTVL